MTACAGAVALSVSDVKFGIESSAAFEAFDADGDGVVRKDEFVAAARKFGIAVDDEQAQHAFAGFDENKDGALVPVELQAALSHDHYHWDGSSAPAVPQATPAPT